MPHLKQKLKLILASASPRRAELIKQVAARFDNIMVRIVPSCVPEIACKGELPAQYAMRTATEKAEEVFTRITLESPRGSQGRIAVLGCDTVVALDNKIFGKPCDNIDAERMFRILCGTTHEVITGICILSQYDSGSCPVCRTGFEKTRVTFGAFCEEIVYTYIKFGQPLDKAGGYGLQDEALKPLITNVEGDSDNVVGLPVERVVRMLRESTESWH